MTPTYTFSWKTADRSHTEKKIIIGVYGVAPRVKKSFALGSHASIFQEEVFDILECTNENLRSIYKNKSIH